MQIKQNNIQNVYRSRQNDYLCFPKKINNANQPPTNENYKFFGKQLSP
jgi:hypothetical protein